ETGVGADVVVEVDGAVEIGVAVVRVLDDGGVCGDGRAVEGAAVYRQVVRPGHVPQRRVVVSVVAGGGGSDSEAVPRAVVAWRVDERRDGRQDAGRLHQVVVEHVQRAVGADGQPDGLEQVVPVGRHVRQPAVADVQRPQLHGGIELHGGAVGVVSVDV